MNHISNVLENYQLNTAVKSAPLTRFVDAHAKSNRTANDHVLTGKELVLYHYLFICLQAGMKSSSLEATCGECQCELFALLLNGDVDDTGARVFLEETF